MSPITSRAMPKYLCTTLFLAACSTRATGPVGPSPVVSGDPRPTSTSLAPVNVVGYWSGDWGNLVFREQGDKLVASYNHDEGTIVGQIVGDKLVGWWCEAPARTADADAGEVEMRFITNADGTRSIDGRWRYGTQGEWKEDWDIAFTQGDAPADLVARFDNASAFCTKP